MVHWNLKFRFLNAPFCISQSFVMRFVSEEPSLSRSAVAEVLMAPSLFLSIGLPLLAPFSVQPTLEPHNVTMSVSHDGPPTPRVSFRPPASFRSSSFSRELPAHAAPLFHLLNNLAGDATYAPFSSAIDGA